MLDIARRLAGRNFNRILTRAEEHAAAMAWRDGRDEAARNFIMQCHVKLVIREVKRMRHYRAAPEDLFSEGMMGMTIALDRFDPEAGFRFSTYAFHWIRAMLNAHVLMTEGVTRISSSTQMKKIFFGYRRASSSIVRTAERNGELLTHAQLQDLTAEAMGVDVEDLRTVMGAMSQAISTDAPVLSGEETGLTVGDTIPDEAPLPEDALAEKQLAARLKTDVAAAVARLKPREQHIIATRKLAEKDDIMTLEDLSKIYGVSRERIRQIESTALRKLELSLGPAARLLEAA